MNDRTMLGVVAVALSLGAFLFVFESDFVRPEAAVGADGDVLPGVRADNINEIVLNAGRGAGGRRVRLVRSGGAWQQTDPVEDRTDPRQAARLAEAVTTLRLAAKPVEARGGRTIDLREYDLADPADTTVVVGWGSGDGARTAKLTLGKAVEEAAVAGGGTGGRVYARLDDQTDRVLIIGDALKRLCDDVRRDPHVFRSRRFFAPEDLAGGGIFTVMHRESADRGRVLQARLRRAADAPFDWRVEGVDDAVWGRLPREMQTRDASIRDRADPDKVKALLDAMAEVRIEQFIDDPRQTDNLFAAVTGSGDDDDGTRLAAFGLSERDTVCRLAAGNAAVAPDGRVLMIMRATLEVSSRPVPGRPDLVYARRVEGRSVFAVRADFLGKVPLSLAELRDPRVLPENLADIKAIALSRKGRPVVSLKGTGDEFARSWTFEGTTTEADRTLVADLVRALNEARAADWADFAGDRRADPTGKYPDDIRVELTADLKPPTWDRRKPDAKNREGRLVLLVGAFPPKPVAAPPAPAPAGPVPPAPAGPVLPGGAGNDAASAGPEAPQPAAAAAAPADGPPAPGAPAPVPAAPGVAPMPAPGGAPVGPAVPAPAPRRVRVALAWVEDGREIRDQAARLVDADKLEALLKDRLEFHARTRSPVTGPDSVKAMTLQRPDGRYELENRGKEFAPEWFVKSPWTSRADGVVSDWPVTLGRLDERNLLKVVADEPGSARRYGLDKPMYALTFSARKPGDPRPADPKPADGKAADPKAEAVSDPKKAAEEEEAARLTVAINKVYRGPSAGRGADVGPVGPVGPEGPQPEPAGPPVAPPGARPEDFGWYLRVGREDVVFEVPATLATQLDAEVRDRRLVEPAERLRVSEVAVTGPGEENWAVIREEVDAPADPVAKDAAAPAKRVQWRVRIGAGSPTKELKERRNEAERMFARFDAQPAAPEAIRAEKFLSHGADAAALAKFGLDKSEWSVVVTWQVLDAGGTPTGRTVKSEWVAGREVDIDGRKLRALRRAGDLVVFTLPDADVALLLRKGAEWLLAPPVAPVPELKTPGAPGLPDFPGLPLPKR